mmetsp:Transcript_40570/g.45699  ORF Transcript_40570/g.45699 Transcript_40570/m.45699 type:complete len:112 (+) Transcript_40570:101-436(+)
MGFVSVDTTADADASLRSVDNNSNSTLMMRIVRERSSAAYRWHQGHYDYDSPGSSSSFTTTTIASGPLLLRIMDEKVLQYSSSTTKSHHHHHHPFTFTHCLSVTAAEGVVW